jgi:asparagine synthase (glutamine-hydrolysing)
MTAFAGIVTFDGAPPDIQTEEQLVRALLSASRPARVQVSRASGALFAQRIADGRDTADASHTGAAGDTSALFVADARLDNRAELASALDLPASELRQTADAALLEGMVRRWSDAGLARCLGAFAFAAWDGEARRLLLGRDCLGNRALFFYRGQAYAAFASSLPVLLALSCVPRVLDEMAVARFLAVNLMEPRNTFYRGIEGVPSRTLVNVDPLRTAHRYYWSPRLDAPPPFRRDEDYIERARELFDQAVAATVADTPDIAIATSGGLDSSAIAATAVRLGTAQNITCYALVAPRDFVLDVGAARYFDERDKVAALGRMHPGLNLRFLAPEEMHRDMQDDTRLFVRTAVPILGPSNFASFGHMYDAVATAKHAALLEGNAGNFGLTWFGVFSLLALFRAGQWKTLAQELSALARLNDINVLRTFVREGLSRAAPPNLRRQIYRLAGRAVDDISWYSVLSPAFIAEHDLMRQWHRDGFDPWFGESGWNAARHRARVLFDHNQAARDFRAATGDIYGFETRDPHSDRRLLEFALAVPEPMYRRNGISRSFARAVFADRLPPEILNEQRRGAQSVAWFKTLSAQRETIAADLDRVEASPLARRLLDLPRLRKLLQEWPADAAAGEKHRREYRLALSRGIHVGRFIRWVEGGNA